ncbi:class I SAM-dependent methyltransferase [Paludibaculum fermentans]|uniref:class I SAM-dependent methyltransferase n=1 Tax=Paludibaculum fermentans TaxID=1473598 RepID=UPI003EBD0CED
MNPPSDYRTSTTAYYDTHAAEFCESTATVDMSGLYEPFLAEIPAGGLILDAGSGSGRDSQAFLRMGYRVVAIDASVEMVKATSKLTGLQAKLLTFDAIDFHDEFDGIWACASLLHIAQADLASALAGLTGALKPLGVLYMSFKHGATERLENGRFFNDMDEPLLVTLIANQPELEPVRLWITEDVRNERRGSQQWINAIVRRRESL